MTERDNKGLGVKFLLLVLITAITFLMIFGIKLNVNCKNCTPDPVPVSKCKYVMPVIDPKPTFVVPDKDTMKNKDLLIKDLIDYVNDQNAYIAGYRSKVDSAYAQYVSNCK